MEYLHLCKVYEQLESTSKRLEKTVIITQLLEKTKDKDLEHLIPLLQGRIFPVWDERKLGMSSQLIIKVISTSTGHPKDKIIKLWTKTGDLGKVAEQLTSDKKQRTLTSHQLTLDKVFNNLEKLSTLEGHGTVSRKIALISELLTSSTPLEAKFITRTVLEELRIGVAEGILRDAITWAYLPKVIGINTDKEIKKTLNISSIIELKKANLADYNSIKADNEELARSAYNYLISITQDTYNVTNNFVNVASIIRNNEYKSKSIKVTPGIPINPMLAIKAEDIQDAFSSVGKPLIAEYKFDGFRLQIHKKDKNYWFYTRRLENVYKQFKEIIPILEKSIKASSFIIDTEVVGFDAKTKKYLPFQAISQRIKRKYNIEKTSKEIPVIINVFDILYLNNNSLMHETQEYRRSILEKTVKKIKSKIQLTKKLISSSEKEIEAFYKKSLSLGLEGLMLKNLDKIYTPGRKVKGWVKLKPTMEPLDLVIVAADYGDGKRAGWLTSYTLACRKNNKFVQIGKSSTGLKEKSEGLSFKQMTKLLKPLIEKQKGKHVIVKPEIVIEVGYEEIQISPNYESGFALRFPRVIRLRNDKGIKDSDDVKRIEKIYHSQRGKNKH